MHIAAITHFIPLIFVALAYYKYRRFKQKRNATLVNRISMTPERFYYKYYSDAGLHKETVVFLINELSVYLGVPADKLLPTDSFFEELAPMKVRSKHNWTLNKYFRKIKKRIKLLKLTDSQYDNLDDYLRLFGKYTVKELEDPGDIKVMVHKLTHRFKRKFADERIN